MDSYEIEGGETKAEVLQNLAEFQFSCVCAILHKLMHYILYKIHFTLCFFLFVSYCCSYLLGSHKDQDNDVYILGLSEIQICLRELDIME